MDDFDPANLDYGHRVDLARDGLIERDLDALLLTVGPDLAHLTGATGMLGGTSGSRPILGLLPTDGEPALLAHELLGDELRDGTVVDDVRTYDRLSHLPRRELRDLLEDRGVAGGRIGVEFGPETRIDAPVGEFLEFVEDTPGAEFVDASGLLWELRAVKSAGEIERIERACGITSRAYERAFESVEPGSTESEIATAMASATLELDGSAPWILMTSGPENYGRISRHPADRAVAEGDMVWMDAGCCVGGYWSDFSRACVVGGPSREQSETQRAVHEATVAGIDAIEPGVAASEVAATCDAAIDAIDAPVESVPSRLAGRVGHGLGLQVTELPSLSRDDGTTLREGTVLTVEPAIATNYGTFHVEENVVVTADGARRLTPDHWELRSA